MRRCLNIENIPIYNPIYLLIMDLLYKYAQFSKCRISSDGEYETFEFIDKSKKKVYFCIDIALNISIECRITFSYGLEDPMENNKHYREFSDTYFDTIEQVEDIKNDILAFVSNKVVVKEYFLGKKQIGDDLNCYHHDKDEIKYMGDNFSPLFIFPWNRKKITAKEYVFEPWIESEFTVK